MEWELVPSEGIKCEQLAIAFGQPRALVRQRLSAAFGPPAANPSFPDEDDFRSPDRTTFIRVRYQGDAVHDIEFLSGRLRYKGVELHDGATMEEVRRFLESECGPLRPTEWLGDGLDCVALGINVASHEDVGGDGDGVEWVILSRNFHDAQTSAAADGGGS
jgi:hypothetical protein